MYSSECLLLEVAAIALTALLPTAPAAALAPAGLPQVVARLQPQARAASAAATPQLLARLDSPWFRHGLRECCPVAAKLTAQSLLARLEAEFLTAELTHNFNPVNSPATWENDVSVATLQNASHFYNLWELAYLGLARPGVAIGSNDCEVNLMGFDEFTGPVDKNHQKQPANGQEAAARPVYATVALLGSALGDTTFGGIAAVFSNSFAHPLSILAPADTGNYEAACNTTHKPDQWECKFPFPLDCDGWPKPLTMGTFAAFHHILLANDRLWKNATYTNCSGDSSSTLLRAFAHLEGARPMPLDPAALMGFVEADVAGQLVFPQAVKLIVADVVQLFGTPVGTALRMLCVKNGWALAWALQSDYRDSKGGRTPVELLPLRIVDPMVAARSTLNITVTTSLIEVFKHLWISANSTRYYFLRICLGVTSDEAGTLCAHVAGPMWTV